MTTQHIIHDSICVKHNYKQLDQISFAYTDKQAQDRQIITNCPQFDKKGAYFALLCVDYIFWFEK